MGKSILTPKQFKFLELAAENPSLRKHFYLTGGTALAEFYLHHRLSEDLDFFCESQEVNQLLVESFLKKISADLSVKQIKRSTFLGLYSYLLVFSDRSHLKVDFSYYPFEQIHKGTFFEKLRVDSLYDIAANKLHTLFMKPRSRDYIDLFYIFREKNYSLEKLIKDAKMKFDWHIDPLGLAAQFFRVKDVIDLPTMLVSFNRNDMEEFFLNLSASLEGKILKK